MAASRQERRFQAALDKYSKAIRSEFLDAISRAATSVDHASLIEALESGDVFRAMQIARIDEATLSRLGETIRQAHGAGGLLAEAVAPAGLSGSFSFNGRHGRAEAWVRQHVGGLIQGIEQESMQVTRNVIEAGIQEGRSSSAMARQITGRRVGRIRVGGHLGLTTQQTDSIILGRSKLASGDRGLMRDYLNLKQRDRRFDGVIRKAIDEGKPIRGAQLDRIIEAHKSKALGYRGRVIARHESHNALSAGRDEGMAQMLERSDVERVTKRWQWNHSRDPRENHRALSGTTLDFAERFNLGGGVTAAHPHDTSLPGSETISCRCIAVYRVKLELD